MPLGFLSFWILLSSHQSAQRAGAGYVLPPITFLQSPHRTPAQAVSFPHLTGVMKPFGSKKCGVTLLSLSDIYQVLTLTFVLRDEDDLDPFLKGLTVSEGSIAHIQIIIIT